MAFYWRISAYVDLEGKGGLISSARWHTRGKPIVYLAESPAGAMLERIVHLQDGNGKLPAFYILLKIVTMGAASTKDLLPQAPDGWKENLRLTRQLGDEWLVSRETAIARIPSAIVAHTWNYLFNPLHPEAGQVGIESIVRERFDDRLSRFGAR